MVIRSIVFVTLVLVLSSGCAAEVHDGRGGTGRSSEPESPVRRDLTLREAYLERTTMPFTLNMVDDESLSYFGVVWRDETGVWSAMYEGEYFTNALAGRKYADGLLVITIHTWGERDGTRTPTLVYEVRYTEGEFVEDLRETQNGEVFVLADVVAHYVGKLEEE